jgi:tripartite-type tricarboxylate transporter receptor subunit TctC
MRRIIATGWSVLLCACAAFGHAQSARSAEPAPAYPSKVVRIIVGNPPGGGTDAIARMVAQQLGQRWGKSIIVENQAGATGLLAMNMVAKSEPDGHMLLLGGSQLVISMVLKKIPFDPRKAYVPVVQLTSQPYLLAINPSLPVASVKDLVAYAKSRPGELNYASSGTGSLAHLGMELFKSLAGVDMLHVPYKGGGPGLVDLMSGRIQLLLGTAVTVIPNARSGKLKVLAVTSSQRSQSAPDVPTIAESGVPGYDLNNSYGLYAAAGTPAPIVALLNRDTNVVIRAPEFTAKLATDGVEAARPNSPADYRNAIEQDVAKWEKFFRTPGLDVESFK